MRMYRQGDVLVREVNFANPQLSATLKELPKDGDRVILAYGEVTGHAHAFAPDAGVKLYRDEKSGRVINWDETRTRPVSLQELTRDPTLRRFLKVSDDDGATLLHEEHAPIQIPKGLYEIIIQREYHPEKIRRVED